MLGSAIGCGILLGQSFLSGFIRTPSTDRMLNFLDGSLGVFEGVGVLVGRLFAETNKPVTPLIPEVRTRVSAVQAQQALTPFIGF